MITWRAENSWNTAWIENYKKTQKIIKNFHNKKYYNNSGKTEVLDLTTALKQKSLTR